MKSMQSFLHEVPGHQGQSANHQHTLMPQVRASVLMCVWWEKVEWCSVAGGNTSLTYVTLKYISKEFRPDPSTSSSQNVQPLLLPSFSQSPLIMAPVCLFLRTSPSLSLNIPRALRTCYDSKDGVRIREGVQGARRSMKGDSAGASWMEGRRGFEKVRCFRNVAWRDRHQPPAASFGLHSDLPVSPNTLMGWG